ncbi:TetR/AcrR family transcriptional regulator [Streptomyces sp. NBC_01296]|uniref:TetR/AcrR family transcriptional regulator n=1 Tax=Streptomyces sp. NBC_01296 TaxID=2903816 RepID=UPI002E166341|nr:TetR/AcrR family transcriptional regulator [Streptomyces sp. NBC_01296]
MARSRDEKRDPAVSLALLWGEQGQPRRGPKPSLSVERIVDSALGIADAQGLDALSMQGVAAHLGVTTMALYRYVPGKTELLDLMVDAAFGPAPDLAGVPGGWRPQLDAWARACWEQYRRRPWMVAATGMRRQLMGPRQLGWLDSALAALAGTGLSFAQQHDVFLLVIGHIRNLAQQRTDDDAEGREEWDRLTVQVLERHGGRFPALTAAVAGGAFAPHGDDPLDFGLERILDGVAALTGRG